MKDAWDSVRTEANKMTNDPRCATRLTDLSVAAALADRFGLVSSSADGVWNGGDLLAALEAIALHPLPSFDRSPDSWNKLANFSAQAAQSAKGLTWFGEWIAASQAAA